MDTDISKIITIIQEKSASNKQNDQSLIDFISEQLSNLNVKNIDKSLSLILDHTNFNYLDKEEATKSILNNHVK